MTQPAKRSLFAARVINAVQTIPPGETRTYQAIAAAAGNPRAARAVGSILRAIWQTDRGQSVPCHRVVRSDGRPGGYAGGAAEKIRRLAHEQKNR